MSRPIRVLILNPELAPYRRGFVVDFDNGESVTAGIVKSAGGKLHVVVYCGTEEQKSAAKETLEALVQGASGPPEPEEPAGKGKGHPIVPEEPREPEGVSDAVLVASVKRNGLHATALALRVSDTTVRRRFQAAARDQKVVAEIRDGKS